MLDTRLVRFIAVALLVALALAVVLACAPMGPGSTMPTTIPLTTETDRFTGQTIVKLDMLPLEQADLRFYALGQRFQGGRPPHVSVTLFSSSKGWRYLDCHQTHMLADGAPIEIQKQNHDGRVGTGFVTEFIQLDIGTDEFQRMVGSQLVEGKTCNDVWSFSSTELAWLRQFLQAVDPAYVIPPSAFRPAPSLAPSSGYVPSPTATLP